MQDIILCDDALQSCDFEVLENFYKGKPIWELHDGTIGEDLLKDLQYSISGFSDFFVYKENIQFVCPIIGNRIPVITNGLHKQFKPLVIKIEELLKNKIDVIRLKINYVPGMINGEKNKFYFNTPHIDQEQDFDKVYNAIFYLNTSTAGTILFNETVKNSDDKHPNKLTKNLSSKCMFSCLKNRLIIFKNNIIHTGYSTNIDNKVLVNINFTIRESE